MATIAILTGNHVCNNPRALKEASVLSDAGFDVHWLGGWLDKEFAARDLELIAGARWNFTPVVDWTRRDLFTGTSRNVRRFQSKAGRVIHAATGWENVHQLGHCVRDLLKYAIPLSADLYIAHSESALWVATELRRRGYKVGVDMEDWFSEDLQPESQRRRPTKLLRALESQMLRECRHRTCTSVAMADALAVAYNCPPPTVVYNAFPWAERLACDGKHKDRNGLTKLSLHWFSQTLGPGRGLEDLLAALPRLRRKVEVHLRGAISCDFREWLLGSVSREWQPYVMIHPPVKNNELLSRIMEHDIGLALERAEPPSRNLTITNKVLQYLQAGLAVAASDTAGQYEVATSAPGAVRLYAAGDPVGLADTLNSLIGNDEAILAAKTAALSAARAKLCWETCSAPLVASVSQALR